MASSAVAVAVGLIDSWRVSSRRTWAMISLWLGGQRAVLLPLGWQLLRWKKRERLVRADKYGCRRGFMGWKMMFDVEEEERCSGC